MDFARLALSLTILLTCLTPANGQDGHRTTNEYRHPRTERFTDFQFISPLPAAFIDAYPKRQEMGDQYLDFMGVIAIVGETRRQRPDMHRLAHVLMGLIDNDRDGVPDDAPLWNKRKASTDPRNRLVLYVTEQKAKYKSFDNESPSVYHQGWSSLRDGETLTLSNIQEELFHFLQRHLWEREYPLVFGLDNTPPRVVHRAALQAVSNKHYVYDWDCVSDSGCLVPEFFFCVMTDLMEGWQGKGFEAPGKQEWRLNGERRAIRENYPEFLETVRSMQQEGQLPRIWPSFYLLQDPNSGLDKRPQR